MLDKHPVSPDEALYIGVGLVTVSAIFLFSVLWRYQWLLGFTIMRVLLRWGRGSWSFPASRLGAFTGGAVGLTIGLMLMDFHFGVLSKRTWSVVIFALLPFVVGVAIRDYILHKRRV